MDGMTGTRTYEQYLAEANAELEVDLSSFR